jgi:ubiquinone/menaquinone biosynthesis C-methylase UbiE
MAKEGMPLPRTLEPEVMDSEQEACDYDAMDHAEVNARFCDDFLAMRPTLGRVLDVGTGTARIPLELCRRSPNVQVDAIDLAASMLAIAKRNVERAGLAHRIVLIRADAKAAPWGASSFDAVVANSIVHHIPEPGDVLGEMWRLVRPSGLLFVRDLARPERRETVRELVTKHAPVPARECDSVRAMHERQRALFEASLCAALTIDEVRSLVAPLGIPAQAVQMTSDRHWTLSRARHR